MTRRNRVGAVTTRLNKTWLPRVGIGVAAVAMLLLGLLDLAMTYDVEMPFALVLSAIRAAPIVIFRRRPFAAWWVALGGSLVVVAWTLPEAASEWWPWPVSSVGVLAAMTGVLAAQGDRRRTAGALALIVVLGAVPTFLFPPTQDWISVAGCIALCAVAAVLGDTVHARRRAVGQLAKEKQVSAAERARRSLVEERARIARELHDVVAHHMSMITVQAETARYRLADLPEPVAEEFAGIAKLARGSLTEMRGLLTALRDEQHTVALAPQPTLANLDELIGRITTAGTPVRLRVTGDLTELPDVLHLSAYRIVQEALSNVVQHASGASTKVDIVAGDELTVEVANERPAEAPARTSGGHGLVGLRERVGLLGGTFEMDQPDGGWRVRATLPIPGATR
jgi:signal transduction histidine kinase